MKDFYYENYKKLENKGREDLKAESKELPCLWIRRINTYKWLAY